MVYPGAMHTRFEHSLGVMHVATRMFDEIVKRRSEFLKSELRFTDGGLEKDLHKKRASILRDPRPLLADHTAAHFVFGWQVVQVVGAFFDGLNSLLYVL